MTNEMIFYLGAALLIASVGAWILAAVIMRVRTVRLRRKLEQEYGKDPSGKNYRKA